LEWFHVVPVLFLVCDMAQDETIKTRAAAKAFAEIKELGGSELA
jgi:hypothetical protein